MKFEPHAYQRYCIDRMVREEALGGFLDMGLGKTVITLTAIEELHCRRWQVARCLVIAPKKVAEATWQTEAAKWDHLRHLRIVPVMGGAAKRIRALETPGDIWVLGRENVPWLVDYCRGAWPFDMVVLDESSSFKNPSSKRFKALKLVRPRIRRLVALTGTPAPNGLEDLWAQVYLLDGGARLGRTLTSFRQAFFTQDPAWPGQPYRTYSPQRDAAERIQAAISDICVSMRAEDYLELPDFLTDDIPVVLDAAAAKAYRKLEREMLLEVDEGTITAGTAAVLSGKLLQLCSGAVYDSAGGVAHIHACKVEAFLETVERLHGEHALVFYWFQHERDRLLKALEGCGLRVRVYRGPEDEQAWNAGKIDLLLAHPASCGYGLNLLRGGHHAIWFTLPNWNLELLDQANRRLHRQGQEHPVIVHQLLVQGSVEEDMAQSLREKSGVQEGMLRALRARVDRVKGA